MIGEKKKKIVKCTKILGYVVILVGFAFMAYTFTQDMSQWTNMKYLFVIMFIGMFLLFGSLIGEQFFNSSSKRKIRKQGIETVGMILLTKDTGPQINHQPEIEFTISYKANGMVLTSVTREVISYSDLPSIVPGTEVSVMYLPQAPEKIALKK